VDATKTLYVGNLSLQNPAEITKDKPKSAISLLFVTHPFRYKCHAGRIDYRKLRRAGKSLAGPG